MSQSVEITEMLEAFRPGIDSLEAEEWTPLRAALAQDPALRTRFETIEQNDRRVRTAMHDIPLPAGLAERLLAAVVATEQAAATDPTVSTKPAIDEPTVTPAALIANTEGASTRRMTRRNWGLAVGGALSIASMALLAYLSWPVGNQDDAWMSREELAGQVQTWLADEGLVMSQGWSTGSPAVEFPIDPAVQVPPRRWKRIANRSGSPLVVYELSTRNGRTAFLFVSPSKRTIDVPNLPLVKWPLTGSRAAGAWQRSGMLYVLVADEDGVSLEDFVRIPRVASLPTFRQFYVA